MFPVLTLIGCLVAIGIWWGLRSLFAPLGQKAIKQKDFWKEEETEKHDEESN